MSVVRRRTNRRKQAPRDWRPAIAGVVQTVRFALTGAVAIAAIWGGVVALDRPLSSVTIDGPYQRVTAVQLEAIVRSYLPAGVLTADIAAIRAALHAVPWVDTATVQRRWPDELRVRITEQVPAARWGSSGLLNTRGELFLEDARHVPAELPRLDGPAGSEWQVAQRYLWMRDRLLAAGLGLSAVKLDARGAWQVRLSNGIEVRLGREQSDRRIELFVDTVAPIIAARAGEVAYIDMRYSNGFVIGWDEDVAIAATAESGSDA